MDALTGLFLAGGRSRRFGSDKSRLELPDGRGDMLQRGLDLLGELPGVGRVAVSCREDQAEEMARRLPPGVELLSDPPHEGSSPLFGVTAALRRWPGPVLTLSCDLPLMTPALLRQLCEARDAAWAAVSPAASPANSACPARPSFPAPVLSAISPAASPASPACPAPPTAAASPAAASPSPSAPSLLPPLRTAFVHADGTVETLVSIYEAESLPHLEAALAAGCLGLYAAVPADRQLLLPVQDSLPFLNMNTPGDARRAIPLLRGAGERA